MALDFDGTDDAVGFGAQAPLDGITALTVLMWIFPTTNDVGSGWWGNYSTNGFLWYERSSDFMSVQMAAGPVVGEVDNLMVTGAWGHYGFTYNGGGAANADRLKIYKDATAQTVAFTGTIPATAGSTTTAVQLARRSDTAGEFSDGNIGHLKIWLAELSAEEVRREMLSYEPSRATDLWQWCPLDDELNARDYSGNERHGTLASAPVQISGPPNVAYPDKALLTGRNNRSTSFITRNSFRRLGPLVPRLIHG